MVTYSLPVRHYSPHVIYQQPTVYSSYPIYMSGPEIGVGTLYGQTYYGNNNGFYRITGGYR
jgi:hypothetical protein